MLRSILTPNTPIFGSLLKSTFQGALRSIVEMNGTRACLVSIRGFSAMPSTMVGSKLAQTKRGRRYDGIQVAESKFGALAGWGVRIVAMKAPQSNGEKKVR
jgi:hypothetical protein